MNNQQLIESLDYHINEVTTSKWREAARHSLLSRTAAVKRVESDHKKYIDRLCAKLDELPIEDKRNFKDIRSFVKYLEGPKVTKSGKERYDANKRLKHAKEVASLPNIKYSASKLKRGRQMLKDELGWYFDSDTPEEELYLGGVIFKR